MSDGTTLVRRSRLRMWIVLVGSFVGLLLLGVLVVWLWVRSDGDIRAVEAEIVAAGFRIQPEPEKFTDPLLLAHASRISTAVRAFNIRSQGGTSFFARFEPVSDQFRGFHQCISSPDVCAVAREIIALGNDLIVVPPPGDILNQSFAWHALLFSRLAIADGEEFDLCLSAARVYVDLKSVDDSDNRATWVMCHFLTRRLADRREQIRPLADWLESMAQRGWDAQRRAAEKNLLRLLSTFRQDDQAVEAFDLSTIPDLWKKTPLGPEIVIRAERSSLLRAKFSWLQFLNAHPGQSRVWLDEAERHNAALVKAVGWLAEFRQYQLQRYTKSLLEMMKASLYARLLAAELRGSPWPTDLFDRAGHPLRRWERDGRLIGAYSVGPNGLDDRADNDDIRFHLVVLDPATAP